MGLPPPIDGRDRADSKDHHRQCGMPDFPTKASQITRVLQAVSRFDLTHLGGRVKGGVVTDAELLLSAGD